MCEFKVLTVRDLDFKDKDNRPVIGQQLWVLGESADPAWNGWEVVKIWIPDSFASTASYCICFIHSDGEECFVWTNSFETTVDTNGNTSYIWPSERVSVKKNGDDIYIGPHIHNSSLCWVEEVAFNYESDKDYNLSNLARKLEDSSYAHLTVIEGGSDPDDDEDDTTRIYYPVSLKSSSEAVESMTQTTAQAGTAAEPDIAVNTTTYEVVETNGDTNYAIAGKQVGVDAETAVASILISLGISPGEDKTDFRTLVSNIIASLEPDMIYNYDSYTYGSGTSLKAWKYNGSYYFSQDIMEHINSCLYNGSDVMDSVFGVSDFDVDTDVWPYYEDVVTYLNSNPDYADILAVSNYFFMLETIGTSDSGAFYFGCSDFPIEDSVEGTSRRFYAQGTLLFGFRSDSTYFVFKNGTFESLTLMMSAGYLPPEYDHFFETYSRGDGLDVIFSEHSESLSNLGFGTISVAIDGADLTYYPVKLFPTLDQTESATQTEIQTDYTTSVPNVVIDVEDGKIIEVNRKPIIEVDPVPDPTTAPEVEPDPTTTPEVDPDPTTSPEIDSTTDPEVGSGSNTGSEVGSGSNTGSEVGSGSVTGSDSESMTNSDPVTSTGLKGLLEWLADFLVSGIRAIIEWLNENLLAGMRNLWELFCDWLLTGFRSIIEWLNNSLLAGIKSIFVPQEDFLTEKVDALRAEFGFADSIISTFELFGGSFFAFETSPPVIYIDLGAFTGDYYLGGEVPFVDLTWYAAYKPTVDVLLSAFMWLVFIWRVGIHLPGILRGVSGDVSGDIVPSSSEKSLTVQR